MLTSYMETPLLTRLLEDADHDLRSLVVINKDPVTWVALEAPGATDEDLPSEAVSQMGGSPAFARDIAVLGRFPNAAAAIGAWLTLAAWTGNAVWGAATSGYCHRAELVGATLAELPDLLEPAGYGELWINFELTTVVDLNDDRFSVERIDRGALVPASCKLALK